MPVWVPDLSLLYVLVPRTGSTAFRKFLILEYDGVDLRWPSAVETGLVPSGNGLKKHSSLEQVRAVANLDKPWASITKVAGVRNPADSLFSAWWKYAVKYPQMLEQTARSPHDDWNFLADPTVRERIDRISKLTFSQWVLSIIPRPPSLKDRALDAARKARHGSGGPRRPRSLDTLWYPGADVYLKFEDVSGEWRRVCAQREWPDRGAVPLFNETEGRPRDYRPFLTKAAARRISSAYRDELTSFGYTVEAGAEDT